jgi:hypothetical protein
MGLAQGRIKSPEEPHGCLIGINFAVNDLSILCDREQHLLLSQIQTVQSAF